MGTVLRTTVFAGAWALAGCGAGGASGPPHEADAPATREALASEAGLVAESGGVSLQLKAQACEDFVERLLICQGDIRLQVTMPEQDVEQTLHPRSIIVRSDALLYRGALRMADRPDPHTFVVSDVNADGHEDLILWSGREGAYGGPSFHVHLFDPRQDSFVPSEPFSDLTVGYLGLFSVEDGLIKANSESGCCLQVQETYAVEANEPKLVERVTTESAAGEKRSVKRERLVDGRLMVVGNE